jgi:uncharacterized protein YkwD
MRTLLFTLCGLALIAGSCYSLNTPTPIPGLVNTIVAQTAHAASTSTAFALPPTPTATLVARCVDAAELVQDATDADSTKVAIGAKFTRTWQFKNTGECNWHGYSIAFVSADRMGAPDSVPLTDTAASSTVNVSVDLVAPANAGSFTANFELRDSAGEPLEIANGTAISVKVDVGDVTLVTNSGAVTPVAGKVVLPPADCKYVRSGTYPSEIMGLINKARMDAGLPALTLNPQLAAAAQGHSADMACNNYLDHLGPNKSTIHDRVAAAGYTPSISEEMIFCSGYPKDAFDWWMGDPPHHDVIFDKRLKEFGVGYAYLNHTQCGSYFTVDLASP